MKNRQFLAIAVFLMAISGSAQTIHSNGMKEKLRAFIDSKEYEVQELGPSRQGVNVYHFAKQFAMDKEQGVKYDGPVFTPRLYDLEMAFRTEAMNAKSIYIHDANEGDSPLSGVSFSLKNDSLQPISQSVSFDLGKSIRLISFEEPDGQLYSLLLMWDQSVDTDKIIGDVFLMDGMIYEIGGWKMDDTPFLAHYKSKASKYESEGTVFDANLQYDTSSEAMTVDVFMAKVKRTCEIFQRETPQGQMAAGVIINKTCNDFKGKLTKQQYFDILSCIQPLVDKEKNPDLKNILAYSCYMIYKKSDAYEGEGETP